jgi:hypothetical protein
LGSVSLFGLGFQLGLETRKRFGRDFDDRCAILAAKFIGGYPTACAPPPGYPQPPLSVSVGDGGNPRLQAKRKFAKWLPNLQLAANATE